MPKVSVIMPLYNAEKHLQAALASVIAQTFTDYELIVIDDCSTDGTSAILATFDDPRIVRLRNDQNLGIVGALNRGLAIARGQYIARMDGDDLA
ncbi:MAG: glycosyltransferase, partial [Anaerolineae bacterium]|nr:glycosyltransferase [Anaerolineae bacterium]